MRTLTSFFLMTLLCCLFSGSVIGMPALPDAFDSGAMVRAEKPKTWSPENMYEHVNGEAELLKRYGAVSLTYASYEKNNGDYLSADVLDMAEPVNAFGLYSLYAGCDGEEYPSSGATVLSGDYTFYAVLGKYFMRIDIEANGGKETGKSLVDMFLSTLSGSLPDPGTLPSAVRRLKKLARKPCEVSYNPEHVDYDLEAGPGYSWIGPDGVTYYIHLLASGADAEAHAARLRMAGTSSVLVEKHAVAWLKVKSRISENYLKSVLAEAVKW